MKHLGGIFSLISILGFSYYNFCPTNESYNTASTYLELIFQLNILLGGNKDDWREKS